MRWLLICGVQQYACSMQFQFAISKVGAANDTAMPRTRTVPIPATITAVPGYPSKLSVFKMQASQFWQMRCWVAGCTHRRSTRTTSLRKAQSVARQFYEHLLHKNTPHPAAEPVFDRQTERVALVTACKPSLTFGAVAAQLYANEQARVQRGEFALGSLQVLRNRLDAHILPQFAKRAINSIDYSDLLSFSQHLSSSLTTTTVSQYLVAVRKVFTHAAQAKIISAAPEFPRIKVVIKPRSAFTPTEYWLLLKHARALVGQTHPESQRYLRSNYKLRKGDMQMTNDMAWCIGFMVNSFIRPSDLRTLKHRHVEVVTQGATRYLRLTLPETKRHAAPIVTLQPAVRIYEQIVKQRVPHKLAGADDYLFLPQHRDRHYALSVLSVMFNWVLDDLNLKHSAHDTPRSLYCLRHSAITFRLLYGSGIDLLTLARNARTSVDVINTHYASTVTGEQNIRMLQSRRTP
jgi:hypothetical protein